jgi:hypothetical protein
MARASDYSAKLRRHNAIIKAHQATDDYLWHGENIIENLRLHFELEEQEEYILPQIVGMYEIMDEKYAIASEGIYKVEEWLTRAHLSIATAGGERPEIGNPTDFFCNYHAAFLSEMHYLSMEIHECASIHWPTIENLRGKIKPLAKWCKNMPTIAVSQRSAIIRAECYKALEIWEESPRTDADDEDEAKPKVRRPRLSTKDEALIKTLDLNGMDYDAAQCIDGRKIKAMHKAVSRARKEHRDLIRSKYPNVAGDKSDNVTNVTNGSHKKIQAKSR